MPFSILTSYGRTKAGFFGFFKLISSLKTTTYWISKKCLAKSNFSRKKEHLTLLKMKFINFFLCLWVIFALLDLDPDCESESRDPIESGSTALILDHIPESLETIFWVKKLLQTMQTWDTGPARTRRGARCRKHWMHWWHRRRNGEWNSTSQSVRWCTWVTTTSGRPTRWTNSSWASQRRRWTLVWPWWAHWSPPYNAGQQPERRRQS